MYLLRTFAVCVVLIVVLSAQDEVALGNSSEFEAKLVLIQAEKPNGNDPQIVHEWLWKLSDAYMRLRRYDDMELTCKAMLAIAPHYFPNHSNLSVAYGKQGKYAQAIEEARIAALMSGKDNMHPEMVLCSWLYLSGKKAEALDHFSKVGIPTEPSKRGLYFACKASLFASVGDVAVLKDAIQQSLKDSADHKGFFERDISFDPYRAQDWFVALVGKTLIDKQ